mmetsp:Transcript_10722/g.35168  ORF Transcript_10722/g.35168 Transcript_10722/m.35168 type:complete len:239 (+) Transcript_10722:1056-1772(+)
MRDAEDAEEAVVEVRLVGVEGEAHVRGVARRHQPAAAQRRGRKVATRLGETKRPFLRSQRRSTLARPWFVSGCLPLGGPAGAHADGVSGEDDGGGGVRDDKDGGGRDDMAGELGDEVSLHRLPGVDAHKVGERLGIEAIEANGDARGARGDDVPHAVPRVEIVGVRKRRVVEGTVGSAQFHAAFGARVLARVGGEESGVGAVVGEPERLKARRAGAPIRHKFDEQVLPARGDWATEVG